MKFTGKEIIGMIHLAGPSMVEKAIEEIEIYERQGLYGCVIENYHGSLNDVNYLLKKLPKTTLKIGVNILPNEFVEAYYLTKLYKIDFIQLDYISGSYENTTNIDVNDFIKHRKANKDVFIMGGIWPKYYTPIKNSNLKIDILMGGLLCDAIVVTGEGTGKETSLDKIKSFNTITSNIEVPLIIGAGLDKNNVKEQLKFAQGAIVGSTFKPNKNTMKMVDENLVKEFMNEL